MKPKRGEVWIVDFGDPGGSEAAWQRPAVVVSNNHYNASLADTVIVVPGTMRDRGIDLHLRASPRQSGLDHATSFQPEQLRSVSKSRLVRRAGRLPAVLLSELDFRLLMVLDLPSA